MNKMLHQVDRKIDLPRLVLVAVLGFFVSACEPVDKVASNQAVAGNTLCLSDYEQCVDPIFHTQMNAQNGVITCSSAGCHDVTAGSGGGFKLFQSPSAGSVDMLANFYTARSFANLNQTNNSKLLLEPLTGTFSVTGSHTGGNIYIDSNDACYLTVLEWMNKQVDTENSASCGVCTVPNLSSCGY